LVSRPCPEPPHSSCAKLLRSCRYRRGYRLAGLAIRDLGMRVRSAGSQQNANSGTLKDHCDCGSGPAIGWPPLLRKALDRGLARFEGNRLAMTEIADAIPEWHRASGALLEKDRGMRWRQRSCVPGRSRRMRQ